MQRAAPCGFFFLKKKKVSQCCIDRNIITSSNLVQIYSNNITLMITVEEVEAFMPAELNVWSDGSNETDEVAGVSVAGAEAFSLQSGMAWNTWHWDLGEEECRLFCNVPGPLQTGQRAGVILALQARTQKNVGADNLNVVTHVKCFLANY